jgi:RNA polymerase sigma factor (sigma-70 family)
MTQATASTSAGVARLLSDDRLTQRATKGDRQAFAAIYKRYHQDLYRYCAAILGNPEDAHDALQNTMVKVLSALPGEKRRIQLKPWLYRIAHNESIDLLRGRRPTEQIDPELEAAGVGAAQTAELRERLRRLIADLAELPDRQRGALVMRELGGLSFEQIGAAFDTSPAVARQTVYEARIGLQHMSEGREMNCEEVCRALSDGDGRTSRRRDIRAHLHACPSCSAFRDSITERPHDLAALAPLPAVASAGLLHAILAGGQGSPSVATAAGAVGAGAGKAVATSAIVKSAATVAVVAAVGVSAADRGGLIHVSPLSDSGGSAQTRGEPPAAGAEGVQPGLSPVLHRRRTAESRARELAAAKARRNASHGEALGSGASHEHRPGEVGQQGPHSPGNATGHGQGRANGLPNAAKHGQQAAASHKAHHHTKAPSHGHPASVPHPKHTTHPPQAAPPTGNAPDSSSSPPLQPMNKSPTGASSNTGATS